MKDAFVLLKRIWLIILGVLQPPVPSVPSVFCNDRENSCSMTQSTAKCIFAFFWFVFTTTVLLFCLLKRLHLLCSCIRSPPLMDITLHMLNGYLLASKAYLNAHLKETAEQDIRPSQNNAMGPETPEVTREELKNALLAAQVKKKRMVS